MAKEGNQKTVPRTRVPRVQMEYDVEVYGARTKVQLPFVMGVLADLSGKPAEAPPAVADRKFLEIDVHNFDARLKAIKPRVAFAVLDVLSPEGQGSLQVDITFECIEDFSPARIAEKVDGLTRLLQVRRQLASLIGYMNGKTDAEASTVKLLHDGASLEASADTAQRIRNRPGRKPRKRQTEKTKGSADSHRQNSKPLLAGEHPTELLQENFGPKTEQAKAALEGAIAALAPWKVWQHPLIVDDVRSTIRALIADLDRMLSDQLNMIIHHPDFQKLESAWRGLHYLVFNTEADDMLKVRFLDISKRDLHKTLQRYKGAAWDQSPLFKRVYEEEYGAYSGRPFACLVGDYFFDHTPPDCETLGEIAKTCSAAHAPFIAGAAPVLMQMDSWQELPNPRDLSKIFTTPEYAAWRSLRESEDARYIALTMPRFLARLPYGGQTNPLAEFDFEEDTGGGYHDRYAWVNSAYACAVNINRSFKMYGWCSRIQGVEFGGAVEGLPIHTFASDDGGVATKGPTEVSISDRREAELAQNGLMPLLHSRAADCAVFSSAQSLQKPFEYDDPDATANARIAAKLPYLFACCRVAHYLKFMLRDKSTFQKERATLEAWLQDWLMNYVDDDPAHSSETTKAQKPLAAAEITVEEVEGHPGYHTTRFYLRPHYLGELTMSLSMVATLPFRRVRS